MANVRLIAKGFEPEGENYLERITMIISYRCCFTLLIVSCYTSNNFKRGSKSL